MVNTLSIQYASKLILSKFNGSYRDIFRTGNADILALLGDIGSPFCSKTAQFLQWCSTNWETTLWVPGLEEWRPIVDGNIISMEGSIRKMQEICPKNCIIMSNNTWEKNNIVFLGSTLWPLNNKLTFGLRHYPMGHFNSKELLSFELQNIARINQRWIYNMIDDVVEEGSTKSVVCLTYTAPIRDFIYKPQFSTDNVEWNEMYPAFRPPVKSWFAGDVNSGISGIVDGVFIATNPYTGKSYFPGLCHRVFI